MKPAALLLVATTVGCAASAPPLRPAEAPASDGVADFAMLEDGILGELATADPRLAARTGVTPSREVLHKVVTAAILDEDTTAAVRGSTLDLFAVRARAHVIARAEAELAASRASLPETSDRALARPKLERELLGRMLAEERARADREEKLGDASSELVRGVVATWRDPRSLRETRDRDAWLSRRLGEIATTMRASPPRVTPSDLDDALFALERLLVPALFPHALAALSELHTAIDADARPRVHATPSSALEDASRTYLGVAPSMEALTATATALRASIDEASDDERSAAAKEARAILFADAACDPPERTAVRAAKPPPERAAICGALRAAESLGDRAHRLAALIALHDYVVVATWTAGPPEHGARLEPLSFRGNDELHDRLRDLATMRPVVALAPGLAVSLVTKSLDDAPRLATAWIGLGDVPIDIAARELR